MNNRLSPFYKNIALWLLITLVMIVLFTYFNTVEHTKGKTTLNYSKFVDLVKADKVTKVTSRAMISAANSPTAKVSRVTLRPIRNW